MGVRENERYDDMSHKRFVWRKKLAEFAVSPDESESSRYPQTSLEWAVRWQAQEQNTRLTEQFHR